MYVKWISLSLLVVALGIIGYYSYTVYHFANSIHKNPEHSIFKNPLQLKSTLPGEQNNSPPKWEGQEQVNVLLLGGDSRGLTPNEIPRSDSIMVASINPVTKKAYLFSILRDTYADIPGHGSDRINAAITMGGPELAMKTVGSLLGIPIQYYVYTDFKGFIALIDAVGGIDINVEKDMYYVDEEDDHQYDINLKKGQQHMTGKTALEYVRFRHDATSDFTRTERQRKFMTALAGELQSGWSIMRLPKILSAIDPYIETNMGISDMLKLGSLGMDAKANDIVKAQLPPMDLLEEKTVRGAEVIGVDPKKLQAFVRRQFSSTGEAETDQTPAGGGNGGSPGTAGSTGGKTGVTSNTGSVAKSSTAKKEAAGSSY